MSNESRNEPTEAELEELGRLLGDDAVWAEPSIEVEDRVIAAITAAEAEAPPTGGILAEPAVSHETGSSGFDAPTGPAGQPGAPGGHGTVGSADVVDLGQRRARRDRRLWPLTVAAALLIAAISATVAFTMQGADDQDLIMVAMAPTEVAPGASAMAQIDDRPNGAQLIIELDGLEPAPEGFFYEVWLVRPEPRNPVSAGTFHMRGADAGTIEFWAGVSPRVYNVITITLESEEDPDAPGELVFRGQIGP